MAPRVTIVTATYGRPHELEKALRSVQAQDFEDFEHLVVEDGAPGREAAAVVERMDDPRFRLIRLDSSRGPAGARNAAVREARGEFIAILDDDDLMAPHRLGRGVAFLDEHPDHVLVAGWVDAIDGRGEKHATIRTAVGEERIRSVLPFHNPFLHSTCLVRASAMHALDGYREVLRYSHDYDLMLRLAEQGRIEILPEVLGGYRCHTENISTGRSALQQEYGRIARVCAERRAAGEPERIEEEVAAIDVSDAKESPRLSDARVQYQFGEWKFRDGRVEESRRHFRRAWLGQPTRPLCWGLLIASYTPAPVRKLLAGPCRRLVAMRYATWR
ncbi:MAG: glycosyltransferase [Planctomycetota bacterium]